jgi:hypothetical protein
MAKKIIDDSDEAAKAAEHARKLARIRMQNNRKKNNTKGGELISGNIGAEESEDLKSILQWQLKTDPDASKIGAIRWAISYAAKKLRDEGKLK